MLNWQVTNSRSRKLLMPEIGLKFGSSGTQSPFYFRMIHSKHKCRHIQLLN